MANKQRMRVHDGDRSVSRSARSSGSSREIKNRGEGGMISLLLILFHLREEGRKEGRGCVHSTLGTLTMEDYMHPKFVEMCEVERKKKLSGRLPCRPGSYYKTEWQSWNDWLALKQGIVNRSTCHYS